MDIKRIVVGTTVGYIVLQALYYLVFDNLFGAFYVANAVTPDVLKTPYLQWANAVNLIAAALMVSLALELKGGKPSAGSGAVIGAVIGLLVWTQGDFYYYAATNVYQFVVAIVDPLLSAVVLAIVGAAIAVVFGRMPKGAGLQAAE